VSEALDIDEAEAVLAAATPEVRALIATADLVATNRAAYERLPVSTLILRLADALLAAYRDREQLREALGHSQAAIRWLLDYGWEDADLACLGDYGERETVNPRTEVLTAMGEDEALPYFEDADGTAHWPVSEAVDAALAASREDQP